MDFTVSEEQVELGGLARKILAERDAPWGDLAAAGVLAAGLPASLDGAGLGLAGAVLGAGGDRAFGVGRAVSDLGRGGGGGGG